MADWKDQKKKLGDPISRKKKKEKKPLFQAFILTFTDT